MTTSPQFTPQSGRRADGVAFARVWRSSLCITTALFIMLAGSVHAEDDVVREQPIPARTLKIVKPATESDRLRNFRPLDGVVPIPFFEEAESIRCREVQPKICRDLARAEFQLTSLRFMVPEVPGLAPKSLTIRRNSVIANYTFR